MAVVPQSLYIDSNGVRLCCLDFGGEGQPTLLLHGLCGRGGEWRETASWLRDSHHVFALDQRAHGRSQKGLAELSSAAFVSDVIVTINEIVQEPVVLIGQSMGGVTAYRVAIRQSNLVRALVIAEAQAWGYQSRSDSISRWLRSWPVPFPSLAAGRRWLDSQGLVGTVWCDVLEMRGEGWFPEFRLDDMLKIVANPFVDDRKAWSNIDVPTLVIRGKTSTMSSPNILRVMAGMLPRGRFVEIDGAGHDVHLERPLEWRKELLNFLSEAQL